MSTEIDPNIKLLLEKPKSRLVTTQSFTDFLLGITGSNFPYSTWSFAPSLDLAPYTELICEVDTTEWQVPKHSNNFLVNVGLLNNPAAGEKSRTVYFNWKDGQIHGSPITFGTTDSVAMPWTSILYRESDHEMQLMEVHNHPSPGEFFSPYDFHHLLLKGCKDTKGNVMGRVRSLVVINPDMQLLALPTPHTPLFESSEAFLATFEGTLLDNEVGEIVYNRNRTVQYLNESFAAYNAANESLNKFKQYNRKRQHLEADIYKSFDDAAFKLANHVCIDFARSFQIKLYSSTDMRIFKEFTA